MVQAVRSLVALLIDMAEADKKDLDAQHRKHSRQLPAPPPLASQPPVTDIVCLDPASAESAGVVARHAGGNVPTVVTKVCCVTCVYVGSRRRLPTPHPAA
jgi:hypothetical protein